MSRPWYAIKDSGLVREFPSYNAADAFAWPLIKDGESWSISLTKPAAPTLPTPDDLLEAGRRVIDGIFAALGPDRSTGYKFAPLEGQGIGSYERAQHCQSELGRIQREDRENTFAKCLASLDRSLAAIADSDDITRPLQAAE